MPKKFDDMVSAIKTSLKKDNPNMNDDKLTSKAYAMATAQWKKMHGGKMPNEKLKDWRILEFFVPIQETRHIGNDFIVKGTAINETTTRNGIKYIAKELENAAPSFRDKPILLDHRNEVKNIVGRTTENVIYNAINKRIEFEAKVMDKEIQNMISDGRITDVSIGASVENLVQNKEEGSMTAIGIKGHEISFVAVPGDPNANLSMAMDANFMLKEAYGDLDDEEDEDDNILPTNEVEEKKKDIVEDKKVDNQLNLNGGINMVEENKLGETQIAEMKAMKEANEKLQAELNEIKAAKEKAELIEKIRAEEKAKLVAEMEEKAKVIAPLITEDKTKGVVASKVNETIVSDDLIVEKADTGKGFQIWKDFSKDNSGKFKRLVR